MRVIRTEWHFDPGDIRGFRSENLSPNFSIAFYNRDEIDFDVISESIDESVNDHESVVSLGLLTESDIAKFIDLALQGRKVGIGKADAVRADLHEHRVHNKYVVKYILEQDFVFANSPAEELSVRDIAKLAAGGGLSAGIALGVWGVGTPILFIAVPFGVILMGTAIGFQKGLRRVCPRSSTDGSTEVRMRSRVGRQGRREDRLLPTPWRSEASERQ